VLATGSPEITAVTCPKWTTDAIEETVSASTSSTWKTQTTWANTCRRFRLVLEDGTSREAIFRFMK
jgi:hypothetical protein